MESIRQYILMMKGIQDNPDATRFCDRFLEVGEEFKAVKWGLSKEFAWIYKCESQLCFENCQRVANRIPRLKYFEGFVSVGSVVEGHAWLVDETEEVIDPTLVLHPKVKKQVEGYMGLQISMDYINRLMLKDPLYDTRIEQAFAEGKW